MIQPIRATSVPGTGFAVWCLRLTYSLDTTFNCFPSLHVAHSFVAALACYRVHKGVGIAAAFWALLTGVSTVYTRQHYAADAIAGALIAFVAYLVFLRGYRRENVPDDVRRLAPRRAMAVVAVFGLCVAFVWSLYRSGTVVV